MNHFEAARVMTMPGIIITAKFDPTTLTVRTRNSVSKMLLSGVVTGGYRSLAARVATMMATQYKLPYVRTYWGSAMLVRTPSQAAAKELVELVNADATAYVMELSANSSYNQNYVRSRIDGCKENTADTVENLLCSDAATHITFQDKMFFNKAMDVLIKHRSPELREDAERIMDALRGPDLITIDEPALTSK